MVIRLSAATRSHPRPSHSGEIELAIERLEDGEVSPFFHDVADMGDEIELRGPLGGHFVWSTVDGGPVLLMGGGSGLVPLMAMVRYRQQVGSTVPTVLLLSARNWDDVLYREELLELHRLADGFVLVLALTRDLSKAGGRLLPPDRCRACRRGSWSLA